MLIRLTTPDQRICPQCSGMGWYYVETPESNRPLNAVLKQCQRLHADRLLVEGDRVTVLYPSDSSR